MSNKKSCYPTSAQKVRLISLLEADEELRNGKFSANFTRKIAESKWQNISNELNAIPGAKKEWTEWRKCWQDMRSKCKKKSTIIRKSQSGTGGGPPAPTLTVEEEGIINLINPNSLIGHADSKESIATFEGIKMKHNVLLAPAAQAIHIPVEMETDEVAASDAQSSSSKEIIIIEIPQEAEQAISSELKPPAENAQENKENKRIFIKKNIKKKPQKRLQENYNIALEYKNALAEKNRLLEEKNEMEKTFLNAFLLQMQQQNNTLSRIADHLTKS